MFVFLYIYFIFMIFIYFVAKRNYFFGFFKFENSI